MKLEEATNPLKYHHGDLRKSLVAITIDLVRSTDGDSEDWSMREVAREAGVSQAAPYRHFENKEALLEAAAAEVFVDVKERYSRAVAACSSPDEYSSALGLAYLQFALDEPALFRLVFSSSRFHQTPQAAATYDIFSDAVGKQLGQSSGEIDVAEATETASHATWAAVHGVADLVLSGSLGPERGVFIAELILKSLSQAR